jgi:hypothetical protein
LLPLFVRDDTSCVIFAIEPICFLPCRVVA